MCALLCRCTAPDDKPVYAREKGAACGFARAGRTPRARTWGDVRSAGRTSVHVCGRIAAHALLAAMRRLE